MGHDVICDVSVSFRFFVLFLAIIMENFPWSHELEEKFTDLWQRNECLYDVSSNRSSSVVGPVYSDTTPLDVEFVSL